MRVPDAVWISVLTLLILQASFLVPPFGYSVLMVRNRAAHHLATGKLASALLPYLLAQLVVLALVLAFPQLLWRDAAVSATASENTPPPANVDLNEMLNQQLEQNQPADDKKAKP
jgi:hypothetical protein